MHQFNDDQNKQKLYRSDLEFKRFHKFLRLGTSSIKYTKDTNSDVISLHVYNNSPHKITLHLGTLGYGETIATLHPTEERSFRVNKSLKLLDICQSSFLNQKLTNSIFRIDSKENTDYFTKTLNSKPTYGISKYTQEQQKLLTMFNFQQSQFNQQEFDQLADLLLKYPMVYATRNFDVAKIHSSLHFTLKPDTVFEKQRASKVPIHL